MPEPTTDRSAPSTPLCPECGRTLTAAYDDGEPFRECAGCGKGFAPRNVTPPAGDLGAPGDERDRCETWGCDGSGYSKQGRSANYGDQYAPCGRRCATPTGPASGGDAVTAGTGELRERAGQGGSAAASGAAPMRRGRTERETCDLNGWGVGTVLRGHEQWADGRGVWTTIRITAVGEETILARTVREERTDAGGAVTHASPRADREGTWTLSLREWARVISP